MPPDLVSRLTQLAPHPGRLPSRLDVLELYRADRPTPIEWVLYDASVIFVVQGEKRARRGDEVLEYGGGDYLILPVSLQLHSTIVRATPEQPFLAMSVRIEPRTIAEMLLELDGAGPTDPGASLAVAQMTPRMHDCAARLLDTLDSDRERRIVAPLVVRELLYRVLEGPQGGLLRAAAESAGRLSQIGRALTALHRDFGTSLNVPGLAHIANMSESTFYSAFRDVTGMTPLTYLREFRLNQARQMLEFEHLNVAQAARRVGYNSRSQFSRDFKTRFGETPTSVRG